MNEQEPTLFGEADPVVVIDGDLAAWRKVCDLAVREPRIGRAERELRGLGRDLRAVRDFYVASRHPRVRAELLREAGVISRRMRRQARRFRIPGLDIRVVTDAA
ncbi:MAG: hypothetical protein ACREQJ_02635 [Candidatus Binatia bacterium]